MRLFEQIFTSGVLNGRFERVEVFQIALSFDEEMINDEITLDFVERRTQDENNPVAQVVSKMSDI
jgi:hypothetical protein